MQWTDSSNTQLSYEDTEVVKDPTSKPRIVLADDNSDMRAYIVRLLQKDFNVTAVTNGEDAFSVALQWQPDLILTDVMMPKLDGFALLHRLKSTLLTRNIPVIFLSARAGEEARIEGINAGADDYMVKPFSAKELVARVANQILINKTRRQTEREFYNLFLHVPAHIHVMKGREHMIEFFHPLGKSFTNERDVTGMRFKDAFPELSKQGYLEVLDKVYSEGKSISFRDSKVTYPHAEGNDQEFFFNVTYLPLRNLEGKIEGVMQFTIDVTQEANANQQIKESEQRFRLLVGTIPQIIWIANSESKIEFLSESWERYTGVSVADGRNKFSSYIHKDDIDLVREEWRQAIAMRRPWKCEFRLKNTESGEYRWFFGHTLPLLNDSGEVVKWVGSASDIHLQKTANEQLESIVAERTSELIALNKILKEKNDELSRAQTFLQTVLDASVELVTAFDRDLIFTFVNKRVKEFSGAVPESWIGKNLLDVRPGFEKTETYQHLKRALKGETIHIEAQGPYSDDQRIFETFIIPLKRNTEITGVVTMQRDVTTIAKLTEDLRVSNIRLKRSNDDLQQFAHVTSHDLKEPVRKIRLYGNILKGDYAQFLPERGQEYLNKIERSTSRIYAMIDGVLKYSSVEGIQEEFQDIDLNEVVKSIQEDLEVAISDAKAKILSNALPVIKGSPTLIYQLFYNLINNSLKFRSQERGSQITITSSAEVMEDRDYWRIVLKDNGIGFHPSFAETIFESFARLNAKDKYEGTGLGLALCKKIVVRHGGIITAYGEEDVGAAFTILLPK